MDQENGTVAKKLPCLQESPLEMKEFVLTYPDGLRFRYVTKGKPAPGSDHQVQIMHDGRDPGPDDFERYKSWIKETTQSLANQWGVHLIHVFVLRPDKREVWGFTPGEQPQLVAEK